MKFEGVFIATMTPFDKNGQVDYERYLNHLEFLSRQGVQGFVPCATTGEAPTLLSDERIKLLSISRDVATKYHLKVIAGCGSYSSQAALTLIQQAKDLGCDAALVVTPYYNKPTQRGLERHFGYLADRSPLPIILYNIPTRTGVNLSIQVLRSLFLHPNIVGIKESSGQYSQWLELSREMNGKSLLAGDDDCFSMIQILGGSGIISASGNLIPSSFVNIYKLCSEGRWEEAFTLQKKILPVIRALFLETNPAPLKFALSLQKRCENTLRLPLVPVEIGTENTLKEVLRNIE